MKSIKRRLLSIFVAMCLLFSIMPAMLIANAQECVLELDASKIVTGDGTLATFQTGASIGGRTGVLDVNTSSKNSLRYQNVGLTTQMAGMTNYLLVDVYYAKSGSTPYNFSVGFRQLGDSNGWVFNQAQYSSLATITSDKYAARPNRWETIAFYVRPQMEVIEADSKSRSLWAFQFNLPTISGTDKIYVDNVRFADSTGDFEFSKRATILASGDLSSNPETVDFQGKTGVQKFKITSGAHTIRYNDILMSPPYSRSNRYLLIEGYLEDQNLTEYTIQTAYRSTYSTGDAQGNTDNYDLNSQAASIKNQTSGTYRTNKWVTVAIDCQAPLQYLVNNSSSLRQMQIVLPATSGNFYINSVRFAAELPPVQYVFTDDNGQKYVYLSEDGTATVDGEEFPAFTTTQEAFAALGTDGGTIYLEGELNAFQDVAKDTRGAVLLRGLGDDVSQNVINAIEQIEVKGGDLTLDYLTINPYPAESSASYTSIYTCQTNASLKTIIIGEHVSSTGLALGSRKGNTLSYANRDKFIINGGYFHAITPTSNYGARHIARLGTIEYTINGGTINALFAGSNNSWEWVGSNSDSGIRGDVKYTINGGNFTGNMVMGSSYGSTKILGNIIWTINGGTMSGGRIVGGDKSAAIKSEYQTALNNVAAIVNLKGRKSGLSTLILGTDNAKGRDISGKEIYILNNYEDNEGTKIADGSLAEYKIHVYHGQAEPVFANDKEVTVNGRTENYGGNLLGFKLTPDKDGEVAYVNGVPTTENSQGFYEIPEDTDGIITVNFVSPRAKAKKGDYIYFGNYDGKDVKYQIVGIEDKNEDGIPDYLLISKDRVMYKAADGDNNNKGWALASLRAWLNSSDMVVNYEGFTTPPANYSDEPGFMSDENMNDTERNLIIPVTHKYMYPWSDADGGTDSTWTWNDGGGKSVKNVLTNYDTARYKLTTDKVFIPSVKELVDYGVNCNVATSGSGDNGAFLLRDEYNSTSSGTFMRYYYQYNYVNRKSSKESTGIRTMLYLDGNVILYGNGTSESPYYVDGSRDGQCVFIKNIEKTSSGYSILVENKSREDVKAYVMLGVYTDSTALELSEFYKQEFDLIGGRTKTINFPISNALNKTTRVFCWGKNQRPYEEYTSNMTSNADFVLGQNMFMENDEICAVSQSEDFGVANAFDNDSNTVFGIMNIMSNKIVMSFEYPADISQVSFTSYKKLENGKNKWLRVKNMDIYAYTLDNVYGNKKEPTFIKTITLNDTTTKQTFDISGDNLHGVTHIIFVPKTSYAVDTGTSKNGGFCEMSIRGRQDKNELSVSTLLNPIICDNDWIMTELGIELSSQPKSSEIASALETIGINASVSSPNSSMSAAEFYQIIAGERGYTYQEFLNLGIASLIGIEELTDEDVKIGICEALMTKEKSSGEFLITQLYDNGEMSELTYSHIFDKLDVYKEAHIGAFYVPDGVGAGTTFTLRRSATNSGKTIKSTNFTYNMPFHYKGGYLGTLPTTNPNSKRTEFADALSNAGCTALRFPGGTCAYQYFIEGEEYAQQLSNDIRRFGGLYDVKDETANYYIGFNDFVDFCEETGIEPIFQVNTCFYVDSTDDKVHAIVKNTYVTDETGETYSDARNYYDHDRITEAANALAANIDAMLASGRTIKYWEIGNEDYVKLNYLHTDLSDTQNPATENYANVAAAFINVIKSKIPDAYIIIAGQRFPYNRLKTVFNNEGALSKIDANSWHYPFSNWSIPNATDKDNLTEFVVYNEVDFVSSAQNYDGEIPQCTTETMTYRYQSWDDSTIQHTFAMALNTAQQWGEAVFETPWEISVLHDLESGFFGSVLYNKKFDTKTRGFVDNSTETATNDIPSDYSFTDTYFVNPSGKVFAMMSKHIGGKTLTRDSSSAYHLISIFASETDDKIIITVVNRANSQKSVDIYFNDLYLTSQTATVSSLYAQTLAAIMTREYCEATSTQTVSGNHITFSARPYSISQFELTK